MKYTFICIAIFQKVILCFILVLTHYSKNTKSCDKNGNNKIYAIVLAVLCFVLLLLFVFDSNHLLNAIPVHITYCQLNPTAIWIVSRDRKLVCVLVDPSSTFGVQGKGKAVVGYEIAVFQTAKTIIVKQDRFHLCNRVHLWL